MSIHQDFFSDFSLAFFGFFSSTAGVVVSFSVFSPSFSVFSPSFGNLSLFDDGNYMKGTTGIHNEGIRVIKGLFYDVDESLL